MAILEQHKIGKVSIQLQVTKQNNKKVPFVYIPVTLSFWILTCKPFAIPFQAGMGDTVFAPMYQLLQKRGVHIQFFHQVNNITLHPKRQTEIEFINIVKQVETSEPEYMPLITVKNLPSWPSKPKYNLIDSDQSNLLKEHLVNLESFWSNWPEIYKNHFGKDLPVLQLQRGRDFDTVVYGMSVASLPHTCGELLLASHKLRNAHSHVKTCATQAFQIWTDMSLNELGWNRHSFPFLDGWRGSLDAYASMNQVLEFEDWASYGKDPQNVAYFCSQLNVTNFPPENITNFPQEMSNIVKHNALQKLTYARDIWPNSFENGHYNWTMLTDLDELVGMRRFDSQYWRANIDPSELYVQSPVNSSIHRITTNGTEFTGIYFTGDWIKTGINMGCVEGAVTAGMQTAAAIIQQHDRK